MKKMLILFFVALVLTWCGAGLSDWSYQLPNNYEVWRINSNSIIIKDMNSQKNVNEISGFVKEFSYDVRYVFTRNVEDISQNSILDEIYYILDTKEQKIYGPFETAEEMKNQANELQCTIPQKWYRTSPDPNMTK